MTLGGTLKNVTIYVKYFWPTLLEIGLLFVLASGHTDTLTTAGNATNNSNWPLNVNSDLFECFIQIEIVQFVWTWN